MVIFSVALTLALVVIGLILYKKRRQINASFRGKPSNTFVVGLLVFVFSFLFLLICLAQIVENYLFGIWPPMLQMSVITLPALGFSLFFVSLGIYLMRFGKHKKADPSAV